LHGLNPFDAPQGGLFPPQQNDQPPIEVAFFTGLLELRDSPTALRVVFALADVAVILLVGLWFPRRRRWRAWFIAFYAFSPFVLVSWTVFAEDKTLLFVGIVIWLGALERGRQWSAWAAASALTVFKYLGAFSIPALALHSLRTRGRWVVWPLGAFVAVFLLSNLPWFPDSLNAFSRRNARLSIDPPIHASPTLILAKLGLYTPVEAKVLTALAIAAVLVLFARRRIDITEAVVWSLFVGYIFLPDNPFGRLLLITLPFMLIAEYSTARWIAIWAVSSVLAVGAAVAARGVPGRLSAIAEPLLTTFGRESSLRHVLWMSLLPLLVLAFYFADRRTGGGRAGSAEPAERPAPSAAGSTFATGSARR
jgi:MFS family permease